MEVFFCGNIPFYSYVYHLFTYLQSPWILNGVSRANGGIYSKSYELSNTTTPWAASEINKSKKQKQSKTKAVTSVTHVRYIYIFLAIGMHRSHFTKPIRIIQNLKVKKYPLGGLKRSLLKFCFQI